MSYHVDLSFTAVESREEAMDLGVRFSRMVAESPYADKLIHDNIHYAARQCYGDESGNALRGWLYSLFNVRLWYWPQYKLAAIIGGDWPDACMEEFGLQRHEFQDGCDQDYEFESWPDMEFFQKEIAKAKMMELDQEEYDGCDEGYARRSALYKNIYDTLGLLDWELDNQTMKFEQMAFSGIYRPIQMLMLSTKTRAYMRKWDAGMRKLMEDIDSGIENT